jgi:hypothetical protein
VEISPRLGGLFLSRVPFRHYRHYVGLVFVFVRPLFIAPVIYNGSRMVGNYPTLVFSPSSSSREPLDRPDSPRLSTLAIPKPVT